MRIESSTDWAPIESKLNSKCRNFAYFEQVRKMVRNISVEVSELSKAEVQARQGRGAHAIELLTKINQDIEMVEEYILVAAILG